MIYQPPAGARDLLPLEVAQKAWINDHIQQVFQKWGYQRIVTSTLELLDTLTAGGAIDPANVIQLRDNSQGTLGLRPEVTASIARAAVTRMAGNTYPQRLCYRANIFRNLTQAHHGGQMEYYQAGVELLFAGGVLADAEMILLLADCLQELGVPNWQILMGQAELTRSLLAIFPQEILPQIHHCIANLDRITLESLALEPQLQQRAFFLFDLRGQPETVLTKVATLDLDVATMNTVNNLKSLVDLIKRSSTHPIPLTLDLSLLQTFDYYTGMVFEAVSFEQNQSYLLGQGGRYDQLLGLYSPQNETAPGIGFSLNIEDIHASLASTNKLPQQVKASDWLVIPETAAAAIAAFDYADKLRNSQPGIRVETELGDRSPEEIRNYAKTCRIENLVWVKPDGTVVKEQKT
ncbi:ATP phosphoribosyltransferase, regulatory subunit [Xenococcus sp. PCC 7305]|uniref:ATP phosphoribosyltransferase regulatory subunit n=1 Tax=Xenococcus sp. PCC 7305 TaxID=102125 RepID=UPI0002ACBB3E|nr:ATP phosphoribosyltransferase regulatory subunit [Xenococcus sp. PCC 7305]ELS01421.1 ATP phosphoribosyltransferase, regulatory subunit [Xenococcus sp. PCC 7305]